MRIWYFSSLMTVLIDIGVWFCLHMFISYGAMLFPVRWFHEHKWLYCLRSWEEGGRIYDRLFAVKRWKKRLPDGGAWFKNGFSKKKLASHNKLYLDTFVKETCRAELTHWMVILASPVFFLWNFTFVGFIMIFYAFLTNLPCIIVQRYNRPFLIRIRDAIKE